MIFRVVVVGTSPQKIVAFNPRRTSLTIINNSFSTVYISRDPINVKETGYPLYPRDEVLLLQEEGDDPSAELYAQCESTGCELRIHEGVE
ncbi:MAG: hypothetical protein QW230_00790 [Thermofilum sp.]